MKDLRCGMDLSSMLRMVTGVVDGVQCLLSRTKESVVCVCTKPTAGIRQVWRENGAMADVGLNTYGSSSGGNNAIRRFL